MKIYLLYGPQGAGKTTQAKLLADKLDLVMISAGEISREIAKQDTPVGHQVKELIDRGEQTPNEIIVPAIDQLLDHPGGKNGFVFDGYPRYAQQIESLVVSIEKHGWEINKVVFIDLPEDVGVKRIMLRAQGERRADDTPEAIARRLELYHQQTQPIIDYFRRLDKVAEIDGSGTVEEVYQLLLQALND